MNNFGIKTPCSQSWEGMQANEKGAFCQSCAKNVIDFSVMSLTDVKKTILASAGQEICGRITAAQQKTMNTEFEIWQTSSQKRLQSAFLFSLIVVFGLSVVSCSDKNDEKRLKEVQKITQTIIQKDTVIPEVKIPVRETEAPVPTVVEEEFQYVIYAEQEKPEYLEKIDMTAIREEHWMGGMHYSERFIGYLEAATTVIEERDSLGNIIPTEFAALAYPNPATGPVTLKLDLPQGDEFAIMLMDMNGKIIQQIHNGKLERGTAEVQFDITDQAPGTYMIAIRSKVYKEVVKVMKI